MSTNKLLHSLIREQNRVLYELVQAIDTKMSGQEMGDELAMAYTNAVALCQLPMEDDDGTQCDTETES